MSRGPVEKSLLPFTSMWFSADECCHWQPRPPSLVQMNENYIAPPAPGVDRAAWLARVKGFRDRVRGGDRGDYLVASFDGERAWVRATLASAGALALKPGEEVHVVVRARGISGNTTLCVALDFIEQRDGTVRGFTPILTAHVFPIGDEAEEHTYTVRIPGYDSTRFFARPCVGIDLTFSTTPGVVDILDIDCIPPGREAEVRERLAPWARPALDRAIYDRPDLAWSLSAFTCHFTFMYDRLFYHPDEGYTVDKLLDDGEREFGGYDALVLWQGYPRLGVDDRNQFDTYRDMPGGLPALREAVARCRARGVKVFVDYNPWDTGTRRPERSDEEELLSIVEALDADGIFLDTLSTASMELRPRLDTLRPGLCIAPEIHPPLEQLAISTMSWAQWLNDFAPPGMLHLKWLEPRHLQHQIRRWDTDHSAEIATAFFNGSGMLVWENVFASYNPWRAEDRALWRQCVEILRAFTASFVNEDWDPFVVTEAEGLFAHRWPTEDATIYTLRNMTGADQSASTALEVVCPGQDWVAIDLFRRERITPREGRIHLPGPSGSIGAHALLRVDDPRIARFTAPAAPHTPSAVLRTHPPYPQRRLVASAALPGTHPDLHGMVRVPGGPVRLHLAHMRRECGCYPDPGTAPERIAHFLTGNPFSETLEHDYTVELAPFYIDEALVSNAEFQHFLEASGYRPKCRDNFLRHWPNGEMTEAQADLPVVYVDLDDARAYAAWAGKRLPTEPEWHRAAQGEDGRAWPWGNEFIPDNCAAGAPLPVRSLPEARSPHGCYHMSGNVWHWLDAEYDDGHTRFAIVRGGSYFRALGSGWYVPSGAQPLTSHAKLVLMSPSLDRSPTIGFRCAAGC